MTPDEVSLVLSDAALADMRKVGKMDVAFWYKIIGKLDVREARAAVIKHYSQSNDRLMPHHVLAIVNSAHEHRIEANGPIPLPDADPDDDPAYRAALLEGRHRLADADARSRPVAALLAAATPKSRIPVDDEMRKEANSWREESRSRIASWSVRCPWHACRAPIGKPCTSVGGRQLQDIHPSRAEAIAQAALNVTEALPS